METGIQSSFIPKEAGKVASAPSPISSGAGLPELLILAAVILLIASAALAGGIFGYQQFLAGQATSKAAQLKRAEAAFEPSLIQQLTRLDDRMHTADVLLGGHMAPSVFFNALDQATLQTISFSGLALDASDPRNITVKMSGIAQSVNSIALQADLFSKNSVIYDPIFSGIDHQIDGVHFNLTALVNAASLNYVQMINGVQQSAAPSAAPAAQIPNSPFIGSGTVSTTPSSAGSGQPAQ